MPMIEATLLEGYDDSVKSRLSKALIRAAQSVMAAHVDGIVIVLREVPVGNYWRGGAPRTAGPALPAAPDIVRSFVEALASGGSCEPYIAASFSAAAPGGLAHRRVYEQFDEALVDGASIVFGSGKLAESGLRFIDRFTVANGRITDMASWVDRADG